MLANMKKILANKTTCTCTCTCTCASILVALVFYLIVVKFILVPAMWWSVLTCITNIKCNKRHVAVILLLPSAIASFWLLEAMSYWVNMDPVTILEGRHVFTWSRALTLPRQICTQVFWKGIGKRGQGPRRDVLLTLLLVAHIDLIICGSSWRGILGLVLWSI